MGGQRCRQSPGAVYASYHATTHSPVGRREILYPRCPSALETQMGLLGFRMLSPTRETGRNGVVSIQTPGGWAVTLSWDVARDCRRIAMYSSYSSCTKTTKKFIENVLYHHSVSFFTGTNNTEVKGVSLDHFKNYKMFLQYITHRTRNEVYKISPTSKHI